jgi:hypothetical protein
MSTNDVDLDIDNYEYHELLNIFHIEDKYNIEDNINKIHNKINKVKNAMPENIFIFYLKAKTIILTIYQLIDNKFIKNVDDKNAIYYYTEKIKTVKSFENYYEEDLISLLINKPKQNPHNNISKSIQDDLNILDNPLNEKNMNVGGGRINPNLNNRNNTNHIENTFPNAIAPGYLNSIKRIIQTQNLNLNSCFRSNYYNSNPCDFLYMIPLEIKNVVSMRLASIEIPNAWYLFSHLKKNNMFKIELNTKDEKINYTIVIPDGNYDSDTLQTFLNTTYFYESGLDTYLKYIKFSIDNFNFKTRFEVVEKDDCEIPEKFRFSINFVEDINQNIMNTLGWTLGFRMANYLDITEKIQSEGLFDAGGDRYIYVSINDYQYNDNNFNTVCFDKSILNEDVIAKIPMINGKLSLIIDDKDNPLTKTRRYNGPVNISRFHIKILDKFGSIIDLNNMDFSFTLELEILYESFNFKNVTS